MTQSSKRRTFMKTVGAAGMIGLAGCQVRSGGGGDGGDGGGGDGGSTGGGNPDTITVGATNFLTGRWSSLAGPINQANDIVRKEINDAGGVLGAEFKINQQDNKSGDPQVQKELLQQWVNVQSVPFVSGINSTGLEANWGMIKDLETPVISTFGSTTFKDTRGGDRGTPTDLSDDGAYVWRTTLSDSNLTIGWALRIKDLDQKRIAIMHNPDPNSISVADGLEAAIKKVSGVEVATRYKYSIKNVNLRAEVTQLFENNDFDAWFFSGGIDQAIQAVTAWAEGGYADTPLMLAEDVQTQKLANQVSDSVPSDAIVTSGTASAAGKAKQHYHDLGNEIHGSDFNPAPFGYSRYDSMIVGALAIHRAGTTDPVEVHKNLGPVGRGPGKEVTSFKEGKEALDNGEDINYQGSLTNVNFNEYGDVAGAVSVMDIKNGEWTQTDTIAANRIKELLG